ncbi:hypothetical protein F0562_012998 [Nyssa sinensis]|uniref:RRM domain-containing protein n=1 Tax=Nyssa sinensis TaxID=561372 RepID=A0A5J4ZZW7_9ASTE|nr:hypothetical protein F0562_012998 [Nyssa sinensis]
MSPANNSTAQFGDTTYTKVFVGGLAWETQKETMKKHFEQFGEILEAVVIIDKNTGRSKGYGFVTFKEAEAARKACVDATPVIDGRRANCFQFGGVGTAFPSLPAFPHYPTQLGIPCNVYGYCSYSPDYTIPMGYYGMYGGTSSQYPIFNIGACGVVPNYYPYLQFGQGIGCGNTYPAGNDHNFRYPQYYF